MRTQTKIQSQFFHDLFTSTGKMKSENLQTHSLQQTALRLLEIDILHK